MIPVNTVIKNSKLYNCLLDELKDWTMREKRFSFEHRLTNVKAGIFPSEVILEVVIDVRGFYRDSSCEEPIILHFEDGFVTSQLGGVQEDDNPNGDLYRLKGWLTQVEKTAYNTFIDIINEEQKLGKTYTSDPLYMGSNCLVVK